MAKISVVDQVAAACQPIADRLGFELVDVEFLKEGSHWYLRIYIDKPGGVSLDDCQTFNGEINPWLDEKDPIPQAYILEVSSPGLERILKKDKDFERFTGELVEVRLFKAVNGTKQFSGHLKGLVDNHVVIETDKSEVLQFERSAVAQVKKVFVF